MKNKIYKVYKKLVKKLERNIGRSFLCSRSDLSYKILTRISKGHTSQEKGKLISVTGFFYSGSSAAVGFFNEFKNISVWGYSDSNFSKTSKDSSEITFFTCSALFKLVAAFKSDSRIEKDYAIKKFINDIYTCYDKKGCVPYEYNPQLYSCDFLIDSLDFIKKVVNIDTSAPCLAKKKTPLADKTQR